MNIFDNLISFSLLASIILDYILHPLITLLLCLLSVFVVLGNLLVVSAIWHENQLHSVTNYLIASLAAADCLVGAVVMPFSVISEIIVGSWTFGPTWCDLWHSFDVLASTASIMNLCAISLDRYLAITNPISYPTKMTPKRVALLIVSLWTCSSLISFPAIAWWRAVGNGPLQQFTKKQFTAPISSPSTGPRINSSMLGELETHDPALLEQTRKELLYRCVFTDDTYYLLFSSIVSFYGPLCVMLYAYYRIYKAAIQQTRFLKYGSKQVMISGNKRNKRSRYFSEHSNNQGISEKYGLGSEITCDGLSATENFDTRLVLRAHRGGGGGNSNNNRSTLNHIDFNNSTSSSSNKQTPEQKNRKDLNNNISRSINNADSMLGISVDYELDIKRGTSSSEDLAPMVKSSPNSGVNYHQRTSLLSKKDRIRIGSQRFDSIATNKSIEAASSEPIVRDKSDEQRTNIQPSASLVVVAPPSANIANKTATEITDSSLSSVLSKIPIEKEEDPIQRTVDCNQSSTIDEGSKLMQTNGNQDHLVSGKITSVGSKRLVHVPSRDKFTNRTCMSGLKIVQENVSEVLEDADYDSDSFSSSSDSYGTGSIASVLVRPQNKNHVNPNLEDDDDADGDDEDERLPMRDRSCDTFENNSRFRRALSVDDHKSTNKQTIDTRSALNNSNNSRLHGQDAAETAPRRSRTASTNLISGGGKHRLSYCNTSQRMSGGIGLVSPDSTRSSRTLDIRSWVKLSRNKLRKNDPISRNSDLMKPPPSLVPLMMMNSDTSTDSSIILAQETRRIGIGVGRIAEDNSNEKTTDHSTRPNSDITSSRDAIEKTRDRTTNMRDVISNQADTTDGRNEFSRNLSFKEDLERGKVQMLYYDSDKLIQSIVDLTDIHYIDCTNQAAQRMNHSSNKIATNSNSSNASSATMVGNTHHKANDGVGATSNDVEKLSLSANDQAQPADGDGQMARGVNSAPGVPRQQRSVGKKLTKLAKERKAAKTLGIVVGVFILCWLPFFVVNIIVALCGTNCLYKPEILLSIVTWLGWLNSAMNPVIYACWSRDFRRAFKRVLCTWVEFLYPYDGAKLARKLGLKRSSNYSNTHDAHLHRTASSAKCNTLSATAMAPNSTTVAATAATTPVTATTTTTTTATAKATASSPATMMAPPTQKNMVAIETATTRANGGHRSLLSNR